MANSLLIREENLQDNTEPWFIRVSSRKRGYDPLTAIAEPLDNATELVVNARHIMCHILQDDRNRATKVIVQDDGSGMTFEQLITAMKFGCTNETRSDETIGYNGVGFKEAGLHFGQKIEVWTKTKSGQLSYSIIDVHCPIGESDRTYPVIRKVCEVTEFRNEYALPSEFIKLGKSGTVVSYEIERNSYQTARTFMDNIVNIISVRYQSAMLDYNKEYNVDIIDTARPRIVYNRPVRPRDIDPIGCCENLGHGSFTVNGHVINYRGYYIYPDNMFSHKTNVVRRESKYRACNFIRNGVVITADHAVDMKINYDTPDQQGTDATALNCFRFILSANAESDIAFNIGANKVLGKFESWDCEAKKQVSAIITPMVAKCLRLENEYTKKRNANDQMRSVLENVAILVNSSRDFQKTVRSIMNKLNGIINKANTVTSGEGEDTGMWRKVQKRVFGEDRTETEKREKKEREHKEEQEKKEREIKPKNGGGEGDTLCRRNGTPEFEITHSRLGKDVKLHNEQPIHDGKLVVIVNEDNPLYKHRYPTIVSETSESVIMDSTLVGISEACAKMALKHELGDDYNENLIDRFLTARDKVYNELMTTAKPFEQ